MSSFNQQASPQSILDQCTDIGNGVTDVKNKLNRLGLLQKRSLGESDTSTNSATKQELSALTQEIMDQYRALTDRVRAVKSDPESQNPRYARQVALVETRLREAIQSYQRQEADFGREMRDRVERQFRIVRPDATEEEVRQAVENNDQVFSQALMRNNRQAQANEVLGAVRQRHQEMLEIERRLEVLMNLLQDMQVLLAKQEVTVMAIDQQAEQAAGDMSKANEELEVAVKTARSTRKKKWICLGICGMSLYTLWLNAPRLTLRLDSSCHRCDYCRGRGRLYHGQPRCERRWRWRRRRKSEARRPLPTRPVGRRADEHGPHGRVCRRATCFPLPRRRLCASDAGL